MVFAISAALSPSYVHLKVILSVVFGLLFCLGIFLSIRSHYKQIRLSRLQTDFLSHISHDLRTPLTSIRLFVETLQMQPSYQNQPDTTECLKLLAQETERLSLMVERILELARMESGKKQYHLKPTPLLSIFQNTINAFRASHLFIQEGALQVTYPLEHVWMMADAGAITEALLNILDNAYKYTGEHKHIEFTYECTGTHILVCIKDNGFGIQKQEFKRIFDKFYRIDNLLSRKGAAGSGLGLSIVKHILTAHQARIEIESEQNKGTCFKIHFKMSARKD